MNPNVLALLQLTGGDLRKTVIDQLGPRAAAGASPPLVAFQATFGPGFYWFLGYCLISLASQQYTHSLARGA